MGNVKTAISVQQGLFERAEALAQEMRVSRSRLFSLALEEYIRQHDNQKLLQAINASCEDDIDVAEKVRMERMRRQHRQIVEGEW